ncbi:glycosyltransferase family 2 protein [Deminuibacter soli]|uniref:Glycosyltransferase family 2 protein n=1 Tax=Deminuibacter soli TaxID=2291815 RepID=A0A3E1NHG6_9BACT|nr:glycosyltransferase family 2 protein [Deminuibacter soli]RFM27396.1 hypothetical protein DXN05_15365 [Deminuibacter soli]
MINDTTIVVLTPVKNEAWILERFLQVTSLFADLIIVADQLSTDNTKEITERFSKALYVLNDTPEYDEEYRQHLLINKAREQVKGKMLLLALDADELITADSIGHTEWVNIAAQQPGTRIMMKKPDILPGFREYLDYPEYFYLGYIDDGATHKGKKIHSSRLPPSDKTYNANGITFMHYAQVRGKEYKSRQRLYSVIEKNNATSSLQLRYRKYSRALQRRGAEKMIKTFPEQWLKRFRDEQIDIEQFTSTELNNYNKQLLAFFTEQGSRKYWWEDIWYVDYENIIEEFKKDNDVFPGLRIAYPPFYVNVARRAYIKALGGILKLKKKI